MSEETQLGRQNTNSKLRRERSKLINRMRTNKLIIRNKALIKLLNKTQIELLRKCKQDNKYYSSLLKNLIYEGLVKMMEDEIVIFCLQRDKTLIRDIMNECKKDFESLVEKELGEKREVKLRLNETNYLIERKLVDLNDLDVGDITDHHEAQIRLSNEEDDKYWFVNKFWWCYIERQDRNYYL